MSKPWEIDQLTMNFADLMTEDEVNAIAPLVCAAPAMARALCIAESVDSDGHGLLCACCGRNTVDEPREPHEPDCALDAALTLAGLDAAAREEVRGKR